ncbi:P-loop containing nucleoside triphosphate hydrolase protein [Dimargaris cristalligena]|uniref:Vesicular-fusion protein SEC18 n=1 Tax=Dimargaris cristalligena TaxID=215637 RepID=A0A4P9ZPH4_9FUNG|nr:P-loop containing nucleoside triphosphate hydrolase protein [Dimargaris cristalligena]|eukprot:RKP35098.1 P-loop containing nucleoside triphosphate hydrolase protein [Dimargaris cristalligena]
MLTLRVDRTPNSSLALTNLLVINAYNLPPNVRHVIINDFYVFTVYPTAEFDRALLGTSKVHRQWARLSLNQEVYVEPFLFGSRGDTLFYIGAMDIEVKFLARATESREEYDADEMSILFKSLYNDQIFSLGQPMVFEFHGVNLELNIVRMTVLDVNELRNPKDLPRLVQERQQQGHSDRTLGPLSRYRGPRGEPLVCGLLFGETQLQFAKAPDSNIRLKGAARSSAARNIIKPEFKFEDMGIGGLDTEFSAIFRRAFASRIFPPAQAKKLGIHHVKGMLLYGPPGTGKTLIARQIGKMLNAREPIVVNGPEILNKFVGQSEENIRKLFAEAEKEYKAKGEDSSLHIIIFDELDAICRQRGAKSDSTGVGDSVVNQLLAKLDGVDQLNNILVIGMTNRKELIDEALLRPGRLEVHVEIGLPDEHGRLQILKIHTAQMRANDVLGSDVNLKELAMMTKNFSGAEINGLVRSASSFSLNRHVKVGSMDVTAADVADMKVTQDDFVQALGEVKPAFGVSEDELQLCHQNGIIHFNAGIERILTDGRLLIGQVQKSTRTPLVSVLLHGPAGSGKTALAATLGMESEFPFIKLISPESMVGYSEPAKIGAINKVFTDAYKSPLSVIIVDDIERLLDWVPIGPRFSNGILQALMVLLKKPPPPGRRLLILATTNQKAVLGEMGMLDIFNSEIRIPTIRDLSSVEVVLKELEVFSPEERHFVINRLHTDGIEQHLSLGIKKLIMIIEMARQDPTSKLEKFMTSLNLD